MRRVPGPAGDEVHAHARPCGRTADCADQTYETYTKLLSRLADEGVAADDLATETLFLAAPVGGIDEILAARRRAMAEAGLEGAGTALTVVGQAPCGDGAGAVEVSAMAFASVSGAAARADLVTAVAECRCKDCKGGFRARRRRWDGRTVVHAANVYGSGDDLAAEAFAMFVEAERLLAAAGMDFGDVLRTWIYLRDIDRDYDALNRARREFFASRGIERRPASTGVQGIPIAAEHDVAMSLFAARDAGRRGLETMTTPLLNEAWTYGADFSRGLRVEDGDTVSLIVSGTASIDESGRSLHDGDLSAQVDRMLDNIATLLDAHGATFEDLASAVTYVRCGRDADAVRRRLDAAGFRGFPIAVVEAPLCRPELLCETEAVASLKRSGGDESQ